ncbi:hypothetical protein [Aquipuribacter hungaricus]|uniref:Phosphodiesterase n=1 Tax=Aquipuribacter hungaricus TaxID=545624 RepID=A0ABV7WHQ0_9MICO
MDLLAPPAALTATLSHRVARLRGAAALHPRGVVQHCTLQVPGGAGTGCGLLDEPGTHTGVVRLSRSAGLPTWLPDVGGVAVRLPGLGAGGHPLDLLFSTAWRWVFVPSSLSRTCSSLVTFRTGTGRALLLGARPADDGFDMLMATPAGPWRTWGRLVVGCAPRTRTCAASPPAGPTTWSRPPTCAGSGRGATPPRSAAAPGRAERRHEG